MQQSLETVEDKLEDEEINSTKFLKEEDISNSTKNKVKIVFFVKQGLDSFLGDIIEGLSQEYETKKVIVTEYKHIDEGMQWADICWFEWCDELIIYGSRLELAKEKKIICRIHGYEVYTNLIREVEWTLVDKLIIVTPHIRRIFERNTKDINKGKLKIDTIFCGVNVSLYPLNIKKKGFNLGYIGYINYKKNLPLTFDIFKKLHDMDNRYKLYLAGEIQDIRTVEYLEYFANENNFRENVYFDGWQNLNNKLEWFKKIDYIVISSIDEGLCYAAAESMCSGIKPILHNCEGIKDHYDKKYIFNTLDEAIEMVVSNEYDSEEYRKYIIDNYSNDNQLANINKSLTDLLFCRKNNAFKTEDEPLFTIGIINYNYSKFLDKSIESVLKQIYKNIEIIIIDDCSVDDSIEKIKEYEKRYSNIRGIFHEKNSGRAILGIQETIREANGKYLMILSADDYLDNNMSIYDFVKELENNEELDYVYSNLKIVDIDGVYKNNCWKYKQYTTEEIIENIFKRAGSGVMPMSGVYRTNFYRKNNLNWYDEEENVVAGDTLNSLIYIKYNFKYKHIDKELICYRHHDKNMTYDIKNRIKSIISVIEYIINNFDEKIYLPEVSWNTFKDDNIKQANKMYILGSYYMNVLTYYNKTEFEIWEGPEKILKQEEIKSYIEPLVLKVKYYLQKSLNISNKYSSEIKIINEKIKKIYNKGEI